MIIVTKFAAIHILYQLAIARKTSMDLETIARNRIDELAYLVIGLVNDQYDTKYRSLRKIQNKYLTSEAYNLLNGSCDEEAFEFLKSFFSQYELTNTPANTSGIKQKLFSPNPSPGSVITFYLNSRFSAPDNRIRQNSVIPTIDVVYTDDEWKISSFNVN